MSPRSFGLMRRLIWPENGRFLGLFGTEQKAVSIEARLIEAMRGLVHTRSGVSITPDSALQETTALRCIRVRGNGVAQVPLKLHRPKGDGSEVARDHPLYEVLHLRPNPYMTSFQFRRTMMLHRDTWGAFAAYKNRAAGKVRELIPIPPGFEVIHRPDRTRLYRVTWEGGTRQDLEERDVWYFPDLSWDGRKGLAAVQLAREALGLSLAAEQTHSDFHRNGARTNAAISVEGILSAERFQQIEGWIDKRMLGLNRSKPLILDNNAKVSALTLSGVESQHLELRKHQIEEVCRAFDVFPQMVGHAGDSSPTFASAEQFFIAHVTHTLLPIYEDLQQSINVELLRKEGDSETFAKLDPQALLRGAMKDQAEAFARSLGSGGSPAWRTQDEVRALEDRNPLGGDAAVLPKPPPGAPRPPAEPANPGDPNANV